MTITIRPAEETDLPEIGRLYSKIYTSKDFDKFTPDVSIEYISWLFHRCPELAFVAVDNDEIVGGYLAATKPWFNGPHVVDGEIFVAREYRRQGIGLRLTRTLLQTAKDKFGAVEVEALAFNDQVAGPEFASVAWHERNGRKVIDGWVLMEGEIDKTLSIVEQRLRAVGSETS